MLEAIIYLPCVGEGPNYIFTSGSGTCFMQLCPKVAVFMLHASLFPENTHALLAYYHDIFRVLENCLLQYNCLLVAYVWYNTYTDTLVSMRSFAIYSHIDCFVQAFSNLSAFSKSLFIKRIILSIFATDL